MPLTLAFEPDNMDNPGIPDEFKPIVLVQPSMEEAGRIFAGINPFGKAVGVHLLPEEAKRVRDHLSKLLLEPDEVAAAYKERTLDVPEGESMESRMARAIQRAREREATPEEKLAGVTKKKAKKRWFQFKLELKIGRMQGVFLRTDDS